VPQTAAAVPRDDACWSGELGDPSRVSIAQLGRHRNELRDALLIVEIRIALRTNGLFSVGGMPVTPKMLATTIA